MMMIIRLFVWSCMGLSVPSPGAIDRLLTGHQCAKTKFVHLSSTSKVCRPMKT